MIMFGAGAGEPFPKPQGQVRRESSESKSLLLAHVPSVGESRVSPDFGENTLSVYIAFYAGDLTGLPCTIGKTPKRYQQLRNDDNTFMSELLGMALLQSALECGCWLGCLGEKNCSWRPMLYPCTPVTKFGDY